MGHFLAYFCCRGNVTVLYLCIVVVVNNVKVFNIDVELQHCYRAAKYVVFLEAR